MRLLTANIGRSQSVAGTWSDVRKIRKVVPQAIIGWQEIDEADASNEHAILNDVLGKTNSLFGMKTRVPISVPRTKYRVRSSRVVFAAAGIPNISPTRLITEVELEDRNNPAIHFVVLNMHYPAGAWNANNHDKGEAARDEAWADMYRVHKARVKFWADKGITVFWVGDVNRMAMPKAHPRERQVITRGIDSISFIEGKVKVRVKGTGVITLNSDHNGHWVEFFLSA